jgi:hypothetical protein
MVKERLYDGASKRQKKQETAAAAAAAAAATLSLSALGAPEQLLV